MTAQDHFNQIQDETIHASCITLVGAHRRLRLTDLRKAHRFIAHAKLDAALTRLLRAGRIMLFALEDGSDITQADRDAAIDFSGNKRHLVYAK